MKAEETEKIQFELSADISARRVVVNFGRPVIWFEMEPQAAIDLANGLSRYANQIKSMDPYTQNIPEST